MCLCYAQQSNFQSFVSQSPTQITYLTLKHGHVPKNSLATDECVKTSYRAKYTKLRYTICMSLYLDIRQFFAQHCSHYVRSAVLWSDLSSVIETRERSTPADLSTRSKNTRLVHYVTDHNSPQQLWTLYWHRHDKVLFLNHLCSHIYCLFSLHSFLKLAWMGKMLVVLGEMVDSDNRRSLEGQSLHGG